MKYVFFVVRFLITHPVVFLTEVSWTFYEFHRLNFFNRFRANQVISSGMSLSRFHLFKKIVPFILVVRLGFGVVILRYWYFVSFS